MIALTFEAGGDPAPAGPILAALKEAGAKATFFLDGRWAEAHLKLVRQMADAGHELGNHGYRHLDWTELSDDEIRADLAATERVVHAITGTSPRPWARPPFGAVDQRVLEVLREAGYEAVYRNAVDGAHWPGETTPASIRDRALAGATDGAVIVFHTDRQETATSLPGVLCSLSGSGFELGPLSQLGCVPAPRLELHPDFGRFEISPGYIRPRAPARWRSLNLLEMGAALKREPNRPERVAETGPARLELLTGAPSHPFECAPAPQDRHVLVLAGELRCDFEGEGGEDLGYVLARTGDLVLWPYGAAARLSCSSRWTGLLLGGEERIDP